MLQLDQNDTEWRPSTDDERKAVRDQLERMLASSLFRNSKRYPALLQYVVEQSLEGKDHLLKERVLGIEVFHRQPDYDTNQDTIVRLTAAEVRKRIALYYQQPEHDVELRIYLHPGSYAPHFLLVPEPTLEAALRSEAAAGVPADLVDDEDPEAEPGSASAAPRDGDHSGHYGSDYGRTPEAALSSARPAPTAAEPGETPVRALPIPAEPQPTAEQRHPRRGVPAALLFAGVAAIALFLFAGWLYLRQKQSAPPPIEMIWQPIFQDLSPALLVVPDVSNTDLYPAAQAPQPAGTSTNWITCAKEGSSILATALP